MIPSDVQRLQAAYARTSSSMLQYLRGAALYAGRNRDLLAAVNRVADEEAAHLAALAGTLESRRVPRPAEGAYPFEFTDLNFVAVQSVLPKVRADARTRLAALESDVAAANDADVRAALTSLLEAQRKHLAELDAIAV